MSYSITKIELEGGRDQVIRFWRENFPGWPFKKFGWLYEQNVFGKACCWTLCRGNKVVGSTAVFPRDFIFQGRRLRAGVTGDFGVDRNNRMLGPAVSLQRAVVEEKQYDFIYGFPNQNSEPVQLKVGFKLLGPLVRLVRVIKTDDYVHRRFGANAMARMVASAGNMIMHFHEHFGKFDPSEYRIELPTQFDERFDDFWRRVADRGTLILGIRDREFLNRRFVCCPYIEYRIFAVTRKQDNSVAGYVVYRMADRNSVHIADLLAEDQDKKFDLLVSAFIRHVREQGFHSISTIFLGNETVIRRFKRLGFAERPHRRNVVIWSNSLSAAESRILDKNSWYLFEADND